MGRKQPIKTRMPKPRTKPKSQAARQYPKASSIYYVSTYRGVNNIYPRIDPVHNIAFLARQRGTKSQRITINVKRAIQAYAKGLLVHLRGELERENKGQFQTKDKIKKDLMKKAEIFLFSHKLAREQRKQVLNHIEKLIDLGK